MILVTGASGNVGSEVVRALASAGVQVRALTRSGLGASPTPGVTMVPGDLGDPASLRAALDGVEGLFMLPGYPGILAEATRAGVRNVAQLSGMSAGLGDLNNAITRYMAETEAEVKESGLNWTILRPSAFMSNTLRWLPQLRSGDLVRGPFASVRTAMIDPADIGAVAALALTAPGHAGRTYELSGPQALTPADQIAVLAQVLGRPLRFEGQPDAEARAEMSATTPEQYVDAFFKFYADGTLDESRLLPTVRELTGRDPRTLLQWATDHAQDFA